MLPLILIACAPNAKVTVFFMLIVIGRGGKPGSVRRCPTCRGSGMQKHIQQIGPGMIQQIQTICSECRGARELIDSKDRCKTCNGEKCVEETKILEVYVEPGMEDGKTIRFAGKGDWEPDLEPGDVIVVINQKNHSRFKRQGVDLYYQMNIELSEALCGLCRPIKTLDDRTIIIRTIPGSYSFGFNFCR